MVNREGILYKLCSVIIEGSAMSVLIVSIIDGSDVKILISADASA